MKTPRDILLRRHQAAETRLDSIRKQVVREALRQTPTAGVEHVSLAVRITLALWNELILPARRIWTGFAIIWLFIAAMNAIDSDGVSGSEVRESMARGEMAAAIHEQQRLMAELTGLTAPQAPTPRRPPNSKPRSEGRHTLRFV